MHLRPPKHISSESRPQDRIFPDIPNRSLASQPPPSPEKRASPFVKIRSASRVGSARRPRKTIAEIRPRRGQPTASAHVHSRFAPAISCGSMYATSTTSPSAMVKNAKIKLPYQFSNRGIRKRPQGVFCQMIAIPGCVSLERPDSAKGRPLPAVLPADSVQHQVWRREYFSSHMGVPQRLQHMNPLGALATLSMRPGSYAMRKCSTRSLGRSIPIPGVLGYLIAPFSTLKPYSWIALRRGDP